MDLATYFRRTQTTVADMARELDLSHEIVRLWAAGERRPKVANVQKIEAVTGKKVTRHDLRPDIFGPAPKRKRAA